MYGLSGSEVSKGLGMDLVRVDQGDGSGVDEVGGADFGGGVDSGLDFPVDMSRVIALKYLLIEPMNPILVAFSKFGWCGDFGFGYVFGSVQGSGTE